MYPGNRINKYIQQVCEAAEKVYPDARIEITFDTNEGEDAYVKIYAPEELKSKIREAACKKTAKIIEEEGYFIVPMVERLNSQPAFVHS